MFSLAKLGTPKVLLGSHFVTTVIFLKEHVLIVVKDNNILHHTLNSVILISIPCKTHLPFSFLVYDLLLLI
jgi:hypothetical protein